MRQRIQRMLTAAVGLLLLLSASGCGFSFSPTDLYSLPQLPEENILLEPCARNTAPCIGLAAAVIRKKYGEAMMLVLPSDHLIRYEEMYVDTLRQAVAVAEKEQNLVTIGITPTYPETGYGYINFERDTDLECPAFIG